MATKKNNQKVDVGLQTLYSFQISKLNTLIQNDEHNILNVKKNSISKIQTLNYSYNKISIINYSSPLVT
jgi:hypothetical protein